MNHLNQISLENWNAILQWVAIFSTGLAFASGIGIYFVGKELSTRSDQKIAEVTERASAASERVQTLETEYRPRLLSQQERQRLIVALSSIQDKTLPVVVTVSSNGDGDNFYYQVAQVFLASGFNTQLDTVMRYVPPGLSIYHKPKSAVETPEQIKSAFTSIGYPMADAVEDEPNIDAIFILVGTKR